MRTLVLAALVAIPVLSACAKKEEVVVVEPVTVEPEYTGKYK